MNTGKMKLNDAIKMLHLAILHLESLQNERAMFGLFGKLDLHDKNNTLLDELRVSFEKIMN